MTTRAKHRAPRPSEQAAAMIRRGIRKTREALRHGVPVHWGILTKYASGGPSLHAATWRRPCPKLAQKVRRELVRFVVAEKAPPLAAIEVLEAFDFCYPRGWGADTADDNPYPVVSRDYAEWKAPLIAAWQHCAAAAGVTEEATLARLRAAVRAEVDGWPPDVVAWYVAQVDAVSEATADGRRRVSPSSSR